MVDAVKCDINKYLKRERRKELPEDVDFWDFNCRFGKDSESAKTIHLAELNKNIDQSVQHGSTAFYIEILAKPGIRSKKPNQITD